MGKTSASTAGDKLDTLTDPQLTIRLLGDVRNEARDKTVYEAYKDENGRPRSRLMGDLALLINERCIKSSDPNAQVTDPATGDKWSTATANSAEKMLYSLIYERMSAKIKMRIEHKFDNDTTVPDGSGAYNWLWRSAQPIDALSRERKRDNDYEMHFRAQKLGSGCTSTDINEWADTAIYLNNLRVSKDQDHKIIMHLMNACTDEDMYGKMTNAYEKLDADVTIDEATAAFAAVVDRINERADARAQNERVMAANGMTAPQQPQQTPPTPAPTPQGELAAVVAPVLAAVQALAAAVTTNTNGGGRNANRYGRRPAGVNFGMCDACGEEHGAPGRDTCWAYNLERCPRGLRARMHTKRDRLKMPDLRADFPVAPA